MLDYTGRMPVEKDPAWGRSTVETACPLDCPDGCSLGVSVAEGKVVKIDASDRHDVTDGFICGKVRRFGERVYGPDRLQQCGIRTGPKGEGRFKHVSWNEALDVIVTKMREIRDSTGAEAILPFSYGGSNGLLTQDTSDAQLFRRFGTSRLARTVCAAPTSSASEALYGKMPGVTYADYPEARLIIVWGANPSTSAIHLVPYVRKAVANGAALVVIDPRQTPLAKQADIHLAVRPGSDVAVALSIHHFLFARGFADEAFLREYTRGADRLRERAAEWTFDRAAAVADVDADLIERVAELYAETSPAIVRCGWGLERNRNGGNAAMAVLALPAVAGKFGVRGGGYSMSNSGAWRLDDSAWISATEPDTRVVNMNKLGRALTEYDAPPVEMLFVYNCNPAVTMPDQNRVLEGLARDDLFTVVFDQVMTDSARWADVVLPATTFLEHYDIARSYGPISLQLVQPVIEPVGDSRPNVEVFAELAGRLGIEVTDGLRSEPEALVDLTSHLPAAARTSLLDRGIADAETGPRPIQFVDVFPRTAGGRVELFSEELDTETPTGLYTFQKEPDDATYPLVLLSPATEKTITSTLGETRSRLAAIQIHPDDARPRGLASDDIARIFNALGEIHCPVHVNPDMKRGTIGLPKGLWRKSTMNGSTANALVADTLTDIGGGACFNDTRVDVTRIVAAEFDGRNLAISVADAPTEKVH